MYLFNTVNQMTVNQEKKKKKWVTDKNGERGKKEV